jgi:ABC-type dipeptide/oligopeptide/nickel transport system permease subunit
MNNFINILQITQIHTLIKIGFLIIDFAFIVFLGVVIKQVHMMNTIVNDSKDSSIIKSIAFILFIAALSLFLTALVIL